MRRFLTPLLAGLLLLPGAAATAAPKPKVPVLAGTVRIYATKSVTIDVRLPKPVNIGDGYKAPVGTNVTGAGRTIGALLVKADLSLAAVEVVRYNFCRGAGCTTPLTRLWYQARDDNLETGGIETLPAGDYRLAVVTDGKPVTAVLKFPGLKGSLDLRPTRPLQVKHDEPAYLGSSGDVVPGTYYSGAVDVNVDGGAGIVLHQMLVKTDATVQQEGGFCTYDGPVHPEPAPHCPGGSGVEISITKVNAEPGAWAMSGRLKFLSEGGYRAGGYYRTVGVAHDPFGTITTVVLPPK